MTEAHARIRLKHGDQVDESIISFPLKAGDEAFRFLDEFEKACGGPIKDPKRDRRFGQVMAERKSTAARKAAA